MSYHSIIQPHLDFFARFGRPHRPTARSGQEPSQAPFNRDLVATLDQIGCRCTAGLGSRIELPAGVPLTFLVGNLQCEGMVCFTKPRAYGSDRRVGSEGPVAFFELGSIETAYSQLIRGQSQSLGNNRAERLGTRVGCGGWRWFFDRWKAGAFDGRHASSEFPSEDRCGTVVEQIDHEGEIDGIVGLLLGHFERVIPTRFAFEFGEIAKRERRIAL